MDSSSFDWSDTVERWSIRWSGTSSGILPPPLRRCRGAVPSPCALLVLLLALLVLLLALLALLLGILLHGTLALGRWIALMSQ